MTNGVGLGAAFNQDGADINDQHAKKEKQAESFDEVKQSNIYEKIQHIKLGNLVAYTKGIGKIVKKDGAYVTVFNEEANSYDQVHVGETYVPGDTISMGVMNKLWDQMQQEVRMGLLSKAKIQQPLHFVSRSWNQLPNELKEVLKMPKVIVGGKEYNTSDSQAASWNKNVPESFRNSPGSAETMAGKKIIEGSQSDKKVTTKPTAKPKRSTKKPQVRTALSHYLDRKTPVKKSDVEHGAYGGVVTDTPFDADDEYEEDHREGKRAQIKYDENKKPENHKEDGDEVMVGYHEKSIINKYNTRYGPRQVTAEEAEKFFLDKSRARTVRGRERVHTQSRAGQLKPQSFKKPVTDSEDPGEEGGKSRGSSTRTTNTTSHGTTGMSSTTGKDDPPKSGFKTSFRGHRNVSQRTSPNLREYHND